MVDSELVLNGQTIAYTCYAIVVILFIFGFGYLITKPGKAGVLKTSLFVVLVVILTVLGVSLHIATSKTIPWVKMDLNRSKIKPDKVFTITMEKHQILLPEEKLEAKVGQIVVFDVISKDLTYGFGIFRQNHSMVCQMQVIPGHKNDLMWKFEEAGIYSIRSTEYSGPKGHNMIINDALIITE
ncbi:MAG TPA: cytochrome C oxidase subunit II [Bacteroidia bacterium]|nr:cytochrome C oxidase subunit II [Bacteroidia bacterium]HRS58953.1 cytochrome C oxidase subunit II [Bacteroidia bacterium]HRU67558.1 cytochrome C oxidase subunit II [Bacteroidia bacterium]